MLVSPHSASVTLSISLSICVCLCVLCFARANICLYCTLFDLLSLHCVRAQDSVSDSNSNSDTDSLMHSVHKSISIYRFRSSCLHSAQTDRGAGRQAGETQKTKETGVAAFHPISLKAHLAPPSPPLSLSLCGCSLVLSACLFVYWPTKRKFSVSINNRLWLQPRTMPARCWSDKAATCCTTRAIGRWQFGRAGSAFLSLGRFCGFASFAETHNKRYCLPGERGEGESNKTSRVSRQ